MLKLIPRVPVRSFALVALALAAGAFFFGNAADAVSDRILTFTSRLRAPFDRDLFDPAVSEDRVKELALIDRVGADLRPKFQQAEMLVRKQRTEIEYLAELSEMIEARLTPESLGALRAALETDATPAELGPDGAQWLTCQRRVAALERERERVLQLRERVAGLYARLDERRDATLGLVPRELAEGKLAVTEADEAERLLSTIHERLFKTLYAIDPELVASDFDTVAAAD
jgi:hypothetical protein